MTGIKSILLSDTEMHQFIDKIWQYKWFIKHESMVKLIMSKWNLMIKRNHLNALYMKIQVIYMGGQNLNVFLLVDLNS